MSADTSEKRSWKETLRYVLIVWLVYTSALNAKTGYRKSLAIFVQIRPLQVAEDSVLLLVVVAIVSGLGRVHPVFRWWIGRLFGAKGVAFNINLLPAFHRWLGPIYLAVLAFTVPQVAAFEESVFRKGTTSWQDAVLRSLLFGLVHVLVGAPLSAAVAIAAAGMWFSYCYFQGGVAESTIQHTTYDLIAVLLILGTLMFRREKMLASIEGEQ